MKANSPKITFNATPSIKAAAQRPVEFTSTTALGAEGRARKTYAAQDPVAPVEQRPLLSGMPSFGQMATNFRPQFTATTALACVTFCLGLAVAAWLFAAAAEQAQGSLAMGQVTEETATRAMNGDLTQVGDKLFVTPVFTPNVTDLNAAVLAGLQPNALMPGARRDSTAQLTQEALEVVSRNKIRMLHEGVVAGLYEIESYKRFGVTRVRLTTINTPPGDPLISDILMAAINAGQAGLASAMMTSDGDADVETMLFQLVQASLRRDQSAEGVAAARDLSRKLFAASTARTEKMNGTRLYRVQRGDSLAYIALQFFGDPTAYTRILEANRSTLQSSDKIQIGQRLIIPG